MPIKVQCPGCKSSFNLKDEMAGKKVRCPKCKSPMDVPAAGAATAASARSSSVSAARPGTTTRRNAPQRTATQKTSGKSSTKASVSDATVTMKLNGVTCPECGSMIPTGELSCPKCRYHLKLKRKIGLSRAIHTANMHSQGMNRDGSKKVTRAEISEERAEKERKIGLGLVALVGFIIVIIGCVGVYLVISNYSDFSVAQLREQVKPVALAPATPETYDPLWISLDDENLTVKIPVNEIHKVKPEFPSDWPKGDKGLAVFAQTLMPPLAVPKAVFEAAAAVPVVTRANELGGAYAPKDLKLGAFGGDVFIWRQAATPTLSGYLRGAILDFSAFTMGENEIQAARDEYVKRLKYRQAKIKKEIRRNYNLGIEPPKEEIEKKYPMPVVPEVKVEGKLSFIPFYDYDMNGTVGSYRFAAENGSPMVRNPSNVRSRDKGDLPRVNYCYFAPVIIVDDIVLMKSRK